MAGRRGVGIGGISKEKKLQAKLKEKGSEISSEQLERLRMELDAFTVKLEEFASKHRNEIKKNPQFRRNFQEMCASAGVDPLASSKGFWAEKLGVGDFYYELAVQIIEVCMASSHSNGGIMTLEEIKQRLTRSRSKTRRDAISQDDLLRAIDKLKILGAGFTLIPLGTNRFLVRSVPGELSMDSTRVFQLAEESAFVTIQRCMDELKWEADRSKQVLDSLVQEEFAWIDDQGMGKTTTTSSGDCVNNHLTTSSSLSSSNNNVQYWFPSLFMQNASHSKTSSGQSRTSSDDSGK